MDEGAFEKGRYGHWISTAFSLDTKVTHAHVPSNQERVSSDDSSHVIAAINQMLCVWWLLAEQWRDIFAPISLCRRSIVLGGAVSL